MAASPYSGAMARELALPAPDRRRVRRGAYALLGLGFAIGVGAAAIVRWGEELRSAGEASREIAVCGGTGMIASALIVLGAMMLLSRCRQPT